MSLQTRLGALITAIGADIKALQNKVGNQYNGSTTAQTLGNASDTYLAGSAVTFPAGKIKVGTVYRCKFNVVKTAAGTTGAVISLRVGTNGSVSDSSRAACTYAAQTAVIDEGTFTIEAIFRVAGGSAVIQILGTLLHRLSTTGLCTTGYHSFVQQFGSAFDVTTATKIGISVNVGTTSAWTISFVSAELVNLTP